MNQLFKSENLKYYSLLLLPLFFLLIPTAIEIIQYHLACISFPYQLDPEEGYIIWQAMQIQEGKLFYRPLTEYPFIAGTYVPFMQSVMAFFFMFSNEWIAVGRSIVFLSTIGISVCIGWIIYQNSKNIILSFICPFLFLVSYEIVYWGGFCRVDLPAIFLSAIGLSIYFSGLTDKWKFPIVGLLFVLVGYTKQIQLAAPVSLIIFLLLSKNTRKNGLLLFSIWAIGGAVVFGLMNLISWGQFYTHTIVYNANEFDWNVLGIWFKHLWFFYKFYIITLTILVISMSILSLLKSKVNEENGNELKSTGTIWFFIIYFIVCIYFVIGIAKKGATANYYLEPLFAASLLTGVGLGSLLKKDAFKFMPNWVCVLLFLILGSFISLHVFQLNGELYQGSGIKKILVWANRISMEPAKIKIHRDEASYAVHLIKKENEPVFCELPLLNLKAGESIHLQPFILSRLHREGKWDQTPFLTDLENRKFKYLILTSDLDKVSPETGDVNYTAEMVQLMQNGYKKVRAFEPGGLFNYYYYQRKSETKNDS